MTVSMLSNVMKAFLVNKLTRCCIALLLNFACIPLLHGDGIGPRYVLSILAASDGRTWVGTEGDGLFWRVDGGKWHRDDAFSPVGGTNVFALCEDSRGRVWAAATAVADDDVVEADASFGISTSEIERDSGYGNPNAGKFEYCGPESDIVPREARE